jgi:hypothetical protein
MSQPTIVHRITDDESPTLGAVVGWEDEDRCLVLWGDARFSPSEHMDQARVEYMDELTPVRSR